MSNFITERVNAAETNDKIRRLNGQGGKDVKTAGSRQSTPVTSEEKARQIRAITDLLSEQLELLFDLMRDLRQVPLEESFVLTQSSSKVPNTKSHTRLFSLHKF